jgi:ATP-dependent DNA helicase RecG
MSLQYVKGVGPQRLRQLKALGLQTVEDACYFPPRRHEDRTRFVPLGELRPGQLVTTSGRIVRQQLRRMRRGQTLFEMALADDTGTLSALWFNQPYLAQQFKVGEQLILYGQVAEQLHPQMIHPEIERVERTDQASLHMGRIVPVYPLTTGVGQRWLRQVIAAAVEKGAEALEDWLPASLRAARGWPILAEAIRHLHYPPTLEALQRAQDRLAFEELFLFQLILAQRGQRTQARQKPQRYTLEGPLLPALRERLPFTLTPAQEQVLSELLQDLQQPAPMHRLLQGDVGCGKTVVMVALMAVAVQSGYQVALMVPTELLAEQHARTLGAQLGVLGVRVALLSQGVAPKARKAQREAVAQGAVDIVVGTHALIQKSVVFQRLALVLIDEQHKFGVLQRATLAQKAQTPDVLVVTATPIPRTLALSVYGDLECSTIRTLPPGRQPISTRWLRTAERGHLYRLIREELARGRQAYVVYPLVEEESASELKAATQMARQLQQDTFPEYRVGLLHGRMPALQKERTMQAFARGELHVLVSTVIVEVGLDVPNATVMVIEHPERFGLAQLHQLRGRIGRGAHPATCYVISDAGTEEPAAQRLRAFTRTTDGFELAEQDLALRGPGQLLGRRQHGWVRFRIADLLRDRALLEQARTEAEALLGRDPQLQAAELSGLKQQLSRWRGQQD